MKNLSLTCIMICASFVFAQSLKAQDEEIKGRQFFAELGGPGVITSINFDSRFKTGERLGLGYRIGVGFGIDSYDKETTDDWITYNDSYTRTYYSIPVGLNYVFGKKNSSLAFEVGAGATFLTREVSVYTYDSNEDKTPGRFTGHVSFMFRRVPIDGGFTFRIGFTPIIGTSGDLYPMGAIGFGYSF